VATGLIATIGTFMVMSVQPQVFQTSALLLPEQLVPGSGLDYQSVSVSRMVSLSTNYAFIAHSNDLLTQVAQQLGIKETPETLVKQVDAVVDFDTAALTITARAGSPQASADLANAVAKAIETQSSTANTDAALQSEVASVRQRMLDTEAEYERLQALPAPLSADDSLQLSNDLAILRQLTTLYDSLNASLTTGKNGLQVIQLAEPLSAVKVAPQTFYYTLLGGFAGLMVAGLIVALREYLSDPIRDPASVEEVLGLPTLGTVPRVKVDKGKGEIYRLVALLYPRSAAAEAYRALRTNIEFSTVDAPLRSLLVASAAPSEGKTVTSANLAAMFAQAGRSVLLVDADLRRPAVHIIFNVPNVAGLTNLLRNPELPLDSVVTPTEQAGLSILCSGPLPPNPAELLSTKRMRVVLDRLKETYDLLVLDSPPLAVVTDGAILSTCTDGTILVVDAHASRRNPVRRSQDALARAGATVLGAVLNRVPQTAHPLYGGYYVEPREMDDAGLTPGQETDSTTAPA
jgi:capsular exopolysaccharide synthesis family protein